MMYTDFDALFERFCIMTNDGGMSDYNALILLKDCTTEKLYKQLVDKVGK